MTMPGGYPTSQQHPGQYADQQYGDQQYAPPQYGAPQQYGYAGQAMPTAPAHLQYAQPNGPIGKVRGTGVAILLLIVTLGFYSIYYYYATHEEMKRHSGQGVGGVVGLLLSIFVGIVSPYLLSHEVGDLYERRGQAKPVSAATGLWVFPGLFLVVGPIIWFVKTNGALNAYWRSLGAR